MRAAAWLLQTALLTGALALGAGAQSAHREDGEHGPVELSEAPRALASNGAVVPMPEIARLGCRDMAEVLALIDRSGYRGPAPLPEDHPDREIFEYEDRLAAAYYHDCIMSGHNLDAPAAAFSRGFETP